MYNKLIQHKLSFNDSYSFYGLTKMEGNANYVVFRDKKGVGKICVSKNCMKRLALKKNGQEAHLNDSLIDYCLKMVQRDLEIHHGMVGRNIFCMCSWHVHLQKNHFLNLSTDQEGRNQNLYRVFEEECLDLLSCQKCFFPIHSKEENHWWLLVLLVKEKRIMVYDSMESKDRDYNTIIMDVFSFLEYYHERKNAVFEQLDWKFDGLKESPQQKGLVNCGIHVILNADYEARGFPLNYFIHDNYDDYNLNYRRFVGLTLHNKELFTRTLYRRLMKDLKCHIKETADTASNDFQNIKESMLDDLQLAKEFWKEKEQNDIKIWLNTEEEEVEPVASFGNSSNNPKESFLNYSFTNSPKKGDFKGDLPSADTLIFNKETREQLFALFSTNDPSYRNFQLKLIKENIISKESQCFFIFPSTKENNSWGHGSLVTSLLFLTPEEHLQSFAKDDVVSNFREQFLAYLDVHALFGKCDDLDWSDVAVIIPNFCKLYGMNVELIYVNQEGEKCGEGSFFESDDYKTGVLLGILQTKQIIIPTSNDISVHYNPLSGSWLSRIVSAGNF